MTATVAAPKAKHIEVCGHTIRGRFLQQILWSVVLGTIAVASVAAVYYLAFETNATVKHAWDHLFSQSWWTVYRHGLRDVLEGVFGKFLVQTLIADWRKHPDQRYTTGRLFTRGAVLIVAAVALVILGIYLLNYGGPAVWHHFLHHHRVHASLPVNAGFLSQYNWPDLITGFVVAHLLRNHWRPIGATITLTFVENAVAKARVYSHLVPLWVRYPLMPPTVRERFAWITQQRLPVQQHGPWPARFATTFGFVVFALAVYGEYILQWVAKGR